MPRHKQSWPEPAPVVSDAEEADRFHRSLLWFVYLHEFYPFEGLPDKVKAELERRLEYAKTLMPEDFPQEEAEILRTTALKKSGEPKKKPGPKRKGNGTEPPRPLVTAALPPDDTFR